MNANLAGHDSHGVIRIPSYLQSIEGGRTQPAAEPDFIDETTNTLRIDGGSGFGHHTARIAMERAIEKAREADTCSVTLVHTGAYRSAWRITQSKPPKQGALASRPMATV